MPLETLPVLSLEEQPGRLSRELGGSFRQFGFAMVRCHGIDPALIARGWELTRRILCPAGGGKAPIP